MLNVGNKVTGKIPGNKVTGNKNTGKSHGNKVTGNKAQRGNKSPLLIYTNIQLMLIIILQYAFENHKLVYY